MNKLIHGITRKDTQKYYSLSVGPTWRFNDWVSAYAVAGVAKNEFRTSVHNLTEKYKTDERKRRNLWCRCSNQPDQQLTYGCIIRLHENG